MLGNKFALTAADVGTGLKESASALATANNSMEQSAAMISAITEITQDASGAGNALKTYSLRLRGAKTELEKLGEETEGVAESSSKMQAKIKGLTGFDIMNKDGFKSTYEITKGLAEAYKTMNDVDRAALLELVAGEILPDYVEIHIMNILNCWNSLRALHYNKRVIVYESTTT